MYFFFFCFLFQAEDGIRYRDLTGVQTCALPISEAYREYFDMPDKPLLDAGVKDMSVMLNRMPVGWVDDTLG